MVWCRIELDDAKLVEQGEEITLMAWGNAIVERIERAGDGSIKAFHGRTHLEASVPAYLPACWRACEVLPCLFPGRLQEDEEKAYFSYDFPQKSFFFFLKQDLNSTSLVIYPLYLALNIF